MYWEDADWCLRAREVGQSVIYEPALVVTHDQGTSSRNHRLLTTIVFHRSALRFWRLNVARSRLSVAVAAALLSLRCLARVSLLAGRTLIARILRRPREP